MENHPLNLAHQQYRRAEAHMKSNRYDEAMQCHQNAAELLLDAMKSTNSVFALESITLQHSYHLKQKDLIKSKKEQYARIKKAMENIKCLGVDPTYILMEKNNNLEVAIYKTITDSETLLSLLANNVKQEPVASQDVVKVEVLEGKKKEKTQEHVVEELQTLSQNLHSLVEQLLLQVEVLKDENTTLKDKVSYLEKERLKYLNISTQADFNFSNIPGLSTFSEAFAQDSKQLVDFDNSIIKDEN